MQYHCEDEGGESAEIVADTIKEAAAQFAEDTVDTEVDDLPDTVTITVTPEGGEAEDVNVALDKEVTFTAL